MSGLGVTSLTVAGEPGVFGWHPFLLERAAWPKRFKQKRGRKVNLANCPQPAG